MSRKMSPQRRAAFLEAVRETGNQSLAAERAKVSRSWVQLHRSTDPGFDAAVRAALRQAQHRLGGHGERKPPSGWGHLDGEELVVKGTGGSGGGKRIQIARARLKQWTPRIEDRFLAVLSATCNVKAACAEVGMTAASAYAHRKRWRAFAERWDDAVWIAYMRLENALFSNAANLFSSPELPVEMAMPPMSVEQVIHLMHMHKHQVHGLGRAPGVREPPRPKTLDEVRPSILRKFSAFMAAREMSAADKERDRREYAARRPSTGSGCAAGRGQAARQDGGGQCAAVPAGAAARRRFALK